MKNTGILLSLLVTLSILPSPGLTFAAPTISIETSQSVYEHGDHLVMTFNVSKITGDDGFIYITDPAGRKNLLHTFPISLEAFVIPATNPFDSAIWKTGTYVLEFEYSEGKSSTQFTIEGTP